MNTNITQVRTRMKHIYKGRHMHDQPLTQGTQKISLNTQVSPQSDIEIAP